MKTQIGVARRTRNVDEGGSALASVDESLSAMSRLTSQLLTFGLVDHMRASLKTEPVDLAAIAREVTTDAAPRALDHGVELVLQADAGCWAMATEVLARELLKNLIDNAINYAGAGATATVTVRTKADAAVLTVEDDGTGVAKEDLAALLERFHRGRNAAAAAGSGLGLSIVTEVAKIFGGSVELAPRENGFRVVVTLPPANAPRS
jgi:two-component system sensor histidine kinase TctE